MAFPLDDSFLTHASVTWLDIVTLLFAGVGALLGLINTAYLLWSRHWVRLKVIPKFGKLASGGYLSSSRRLFEGATEPSIDVVNLSSFPITIIEVGYTLRDTSIEERRLAAPSPLVTDQKPWPRKLDPRESVTAHLEAEVLREPIHKAYARTSSGEVRYGQSSALDEFIRAQQEFMRTKTDS